MEESSSYYSPNPHSGWLGRSGAWAAVKALRPKNSKGEKSHAELPKGEPDPHKKEEL